MPCIQYRSMVDLKNKVGHPGQPNLKLVPGKMLWESEGGQQSSRSRQATPAEVEDCANCMCVAENADTEHEDRIKFLLFQI